jgi:DNA helicase-2/ATP-dependent DNA helicase PcrA
LQGSQKTVPAAAPALPFDADDPTTIQTGMEVEHQKFGTGKVMHVEGVYPELRATVSFPGHGNKQLLLKYAKLRIIG